MLGLALAAVLVAAYFAYDATQKKDELKEANIKTQQALDNYLEADSLRKVTEIRNLESMANNFLNLNQKELAVRVLQEAFEKDTTRQDIRRRLDTLSSE